MELKLHVLNGSGRPKYNTAIWTQPELVGLLMEKLMRQKMMGVYRK